VSRPATAAVVALALLLTGCAERTQGSPTPGDDPAGQTTTTTTTTTTTESPTTSTEAGGLADVEPCGLVDDAGLATLGVGAGEEKTLGEARVCQWRHEGPTLNESFTLSVALFENRGLADIVGTDVTRLPDIGSHPASSFVAPGGSCGVSLGVGESSRVDSTAVGGDRQQGCQLAASLAALVEPKLP
jgi:hypothetical protein